MDDVAKFWLWVESEEAPRFYIGGIVGGDCDYRYFDCVAIASGSGGT